MTVAPTERPCCLEPPLASSRNRRPLLTRWRSRALGPRRLGQVRHPQTPSGSPPTNSSTSFALRPCPSHPEPPRPRSPTSEAPPNVAASYTANPPTPSGIIARLIDVLAGSEDFGSGQPCGQGDVTVISSLPGVGQTVLATLLAEAPQALMRRDYKARRCMCGVAPVTRRSGKCELVVRRITAHARLRDAGYHWARVAVQRDAFSKAKGTPPFAGATTATRAVRSVADRLLAVALRKAPNPDLLPARTPSGGSYGLISSPGAAHIRVRAIAGEANGDHDRAALTASGRAVTERRRRPLALWDDVSQATGGHAADARLGGAEPRSVGSGSPRNMVWRSVPLSHQLTGDLEDAL